MKRYISRIVLGVIVIAVLIVSFWFNGSPQITHQRTDTEVIPGVTERAEQTENENSDITSDNNGDKSDVDLKENDAVSEDKTTHSEALPEEETQPFEPPGAVETDKPKNDNTSDKGLYCTLSVRCDTILDNMSMLKPEKKELIPVDGVILSERQVEFFEGETVFNLLKRELKKNKIHMEFVNTPVYNSAYIEGIANIYEYDCGELSGWMYRVNGIFPNYGCSQYKLSSGDKVEWLYSCNLGADIGGKYLSGGGQKDE